MSNIIIRRNRDFYIKARKAGQFLDENDLFILFTLLPLIPNKETANLIRVRRFDNAERTFTLSDLSDLQAWVVAGGGTQNGRITIWYDLVSGREVRQTSAGLQPFIVRSGALVTDSNGNLSVDFDGGNYFLEATTVYMPNTANGITDFTVMEQIGNNPTTGSGQFGAAWACGILGGSAGYGMATLTDVTPKTVESQIRILTAASRNIVNLPTDVFLSTSTFTTTNNSIGINGGTETDLAHTLGTVTPNIRLTFGTRLLINDTTNFFINAKIPFMCLYNTLKSNRADINTFIKDKYGIN